MSLATLDDLKKALRAMGKPEVAESLLDAADLLDEASDLVEGHLWPSTVPDPIPPAITRVVATAAALALTRPTEILPETQSLQADGFGVTFTPGGNTPGPYLTAALKQRLRPYRSGMSSVQQEGEGY